MTMIIMKPFLKVETLELNECNLGMKMKDLSACFPALRGLSLVDVVIGNYSLNSIQQSKSISPVWNVCPFGALKKLSPNPLEKFFA